MAGPAAAAPEAEGRPATPVAAAPPVTDSTATGPAVPAPATDTGPVAGPAAGPVWGLQENGDFLVRLAGTDWRLTAAEIAQAELNLRDKPQPMPGLEFRTARFDSRQRKLSVTAGLAVPHLADGELTLEVDRQLRPRLRGTLSRAFDLPALGRTTLTVGLDENFALTGTVEVPAANLAPRGIRGLTVEGSGSISLAGRMLSGQGTVNITYADLGSGTVNFGFDQEGGFTGSGSVTITPPFLSQVRADVAADPAGNISAHVELPLSGQSSPVPNLTLTGGMLALDYRNGTPGLALSDFGARYAGFGSITLASLALDAGLKPSGSGSFDAQIPMLTTTAGTVTVRNGRVSGQITLGKDNFPEGLPVRSGQITARLGEDGGLGFSGNVRADFGPAGTADVAAAYGPEGFAIAGAADLTIPGLNPIHLTASYRDGDLEGSVRVPVDSGLLPGLSGDVEVRYGQGRWSGETVLSYSADNGKLSGTVTVTVAQNEAGGIELGGTGQVTAQLMPGLQGTLTATILAQGGVDVSGEIVVTDPYQLFPEQRLDKELFSYAQNIPLWAILVAVIRVRAGVRAGIGPGVFRDIKVTGSYTLGSEESDPSFTISGEMYIPAFVEGYVAFGAGLGLDVVLGSLTGGIEGVATAGLYGAISVVPELSYAGGDWSIDGTATLAAGARLKLGLNAWAEVEALWITVWEQTWNLAEIVMPVGPDLALQAHMHYTFGQPQAPELEFKTSDIDSERLISDAMPKDGPPASGAREALENKAEWKGKLKEQREAAVPPAQAAQAGAAPEVPAPPAKPPKPAPPGAGAQATGEGANADPGATPTVQNEGARSEAVDQAAAPDTSAAGTVPESALPNTDQPRFPNGITLDMLNEPPVPEVRTAAQQKDDLDAAMKILDMAEAQATDSDVLDNYFPRIKDRFRLTSLGYEGDFDKGFEVVAKINPEGHDRPDLPLSGTGLPGNLTHQTRFLPPNTEILGGDEVGVRFTAKPLGPDHPAGSGPTGQAKLMGSLPTGQKYSADANANYVRGHLLNDWLGGPGEPSNLFPITAHANSIHLNSIEADVKKWVNEKRFWVAYEVRIKEDSKSIDATVEDNFVNATITATAHVLNMKLGPVPAYTRSVTIQSVFEKPAEAKTVAETANSSALDQLQARPEDLALTINATTRAGEAPSLDAAIRADLARVSIPGRTRGYISGLLLAANGMGQARVEVMWEAYDLDRAQPGRSFDDKTADWKAALTWVRNNWSVLRALLPA